MAPTHPLFFKTAGSVSVAHERHDSIKSVQKRALRIIYSFSNDIPYITLSQIWRAYHLEETTSFINFSIPYNPHPTYSLHSLLSPPRDPDLLARLRAPPIPPHTHTNEKNISPCIICPIKHRFYLHLQ